MTTPGPSPYAAYRAVLTRKRDAANANAADATLSEGSRLYWREEAARLGGLIASLDAIGKETTTP